MTAGSILVGIAILIIVAVFVGRPLLISKMPQHKGDYQSQRLLLLQQKATLLARIQSLDFDYETGKMPTDLYEPQRVQLVKQAARLIERLETAVSTGNHAQNGSSAELDTKIEAAISRLREKPAANGRFCPQCGFAVNSDDIFCSSCGHKLGK